ncbi:MAG: D-glycero-beta-D-manno-heptose 1,7-bisphosphate 7-phosphatase [Deltaproteobacteria bacterium]|jgi:D-glycero-D-manno-heptose 1,7-bisphosphate phosphatase|nr:D-glycero-beta-D-manno-heptose 1,7-bisphosphate 7-phosphatase [Deltaproteobacteria bacterium]
MGGTKIIFLDRDGVLNEDSPDFITAPDQWHPIAGSLEAVAALSQAGYRIAIVTNQSAIARGLLDEPGLEAIHSKLRGEVEACGGRIDVILHCPHAPDAGCACRKPAPGLIEAASAALDVDPRGAPLVGDRLSDLEAARRAGCRPLLVRSGRLTPADLRSVESEGVGVYPDLATAAEALLASEVAGGR